MENKLYFFTAIIGLFWILYHLAVYWRTKVPIVITPKGYIKELFRNLDKETIGANKVVYELGSGNGDFLFAAEKLGPKKLIGYELSPWHLFYCKIKAKFTRSRAVFLGRDFFRVDLSDADVVYVFLVPEVVKKLWRKIKAECKPE